MGNILDQLVSKVEEEMDEDEVIVPSKCNECKTSIICSVFPTLLAISKTGIILEIERCPFHDKERN